MDVHHQWTKVLQLLSLWYDPNAAQSSLTSVLMWLQLFQQLPVYRSLQQQTDWLKERISLLLGGVQVKHLERFGPVQPIIEHCSNLSMFHKTLLTHQLYLHPRSLQGLSVLLDKYDGTLPLEDSNTVFCLLTWSWDQCFLSITAAILTQVCMRWDISLSPPVLALPNFSCSSRGMRRRPGAAHNAKACESGKAGSTLVSMTPTLFLYAYRHSVVQCGGGTVAHQPLPVDWAVSWHCLDSVIGVSTWRGCMIWAEPPCAAAVSNGPGTFPQPLPVQNQPDSLRRAKWPVANTCKTILIANWISFLCWLSQIYMLFPDNRTGSHIRNAVDFVDYVIPVLFWIVRHIQEVSEVEPFVFLHWSNADGTRTTCRLQGEGTWAPTTTWATAPMMSFCNAAHSLMAL